MNLVDKFLQAVSANPAAPACIFNDQVISREMLHQLACKVAAFLHERGIEQGEVVGVSMDHSPLHLATLIALARLGAISLPVHPSSALPVQTRLLERFGAKKLLCIKAPAIRSDFVIISLGELSVDENSRLNMGFIEYWPDKNTPARLGLTSGTTGAAGAILYTHEYWLLRINHYVEECDDQSRMMSSDLHLTMGSLSALGVLFAGGLVVFHKLNDFQSFVKSINLYAVTHMFMPPAMIKNLTAQLPYDGVAFPTVRDLKIIGSGLSEHLFELATRKITPHVSLPYGTSETGRISLATPAVLASHPGYTGYVDPGVEVQAVDAAGDVLPFGTLGELRTRAPGMPQSYYMNEERTALRFKEGWFMTGDTGYVTQEGLVKIEGRMDDRINLDGFKFYPERIESVLGAHPELKECAVFEIAGPDQKKILVAAVVPKHPPPFELKLSDYCQQKKLGNMTPRRFILVRELPRNPTGKLIRSMLPDLFVKKMEQSN